MVVQTHHYSSYYSRYRASSKKADFIIDCVTPVDRFGNLTALQKLAVSEMNPNVETSQVNTLTVRFNTCALR